MGFFKIRRNLVVGGGSVQLGADVGLFRDSANVARTNDALTVDGIITASAGISSTKGGTVTGGTTDIGGATALIVPYQVATPDVNKNGHFSFLQKGDRSYMLYEMGGTPCYITLPQVTSATALFTIGGTP